MIRHRSGRGSVVSGGPFMILLLAATTALSGCGGGAPGRPGAAAAGHRPSAGSSGNTGGAGPGGSAINPANFVGKIDNPYMPWIPGTRFRYEGVTDEGRETTKVEVTSQTRKILGVTAVVVHDVVYRKGKLIEDTYDWYAQDREGNVWYLGEDTKEYKDGKVVSTEGSWEAGKDGARAGIVMKAHPRVGDRYRQEYYKGHAEDMGEVLSVTERITVRSVRYDQVVKTKDTTPLEPDLVENKFYARGVGVIREVHLSGGKERSELVEVTGPGRN
jgi:hypothetical protein